MAMSVGFNTSNDLFDAFTSVLPIGVVEVDVVGVGGELSSIGVRTSVDHVVA